jgi:hypothetical protein
LHVYFCFSFCLVARVSLEALTYVPVPGSRHGPCRKLGAL